VDFLAVLIQLFCWVLQLRRYERK